MLTVMIVSKMKMIPCTKQILTDKLMVIPDLIPAMGKNHIDGYMRKEDLLGEHLDEYDAYTVKLTDDELEAAREQYSNQYDDVTTVDFYKKCVDVPLYDVSGEKEVDKFTVTIGYYPYPEND